MGTAERSAGRLPASHRAKLATLLIAGLVLAGCTGGTTSSPAASGSASTEPGTSATAAAQEEIVLTCGICENRPGDVFLEYRNSLAEGFNAEYAGKYRIEILPSPAAGEEQQTWERLALAGQLPDLFIAGARTIKDLDETGALMDVGPFLGADAAWKSTFYPDIFARITTDDGRILGIPEQRDVAGIFYNTELFSKAGVATFPQTWDEFNTDAAKLKEAGTIPFASAPNWVPLLLWSHRVGTEEGGPDFLLNGITQGNYAANPAVVTATEWLRDFYADGYVNKDAFSGDFPVARTPFIQGQAAMITNGPWMVNADIKSTEAQPDLATKIGYEPAPGDGLIIIGGDAAWVSAAKPEKAEAVAAFLKFSTTPEQQFARTLKTGSYGPTQVEFTADQKAQLEPLALSLVERSATARTYTHALGSASSEFDQAWRNNWPAYVQGQMTTTEFLNSLSAG